MKPGSFLIASILLLPAVYSCDNKEKRIYAVDELKMPLDTDTAWRIAMRKFSLNFNRYRRENDLPLLPENFYLVKGGDDYAEWRNPTNNFPAYETKIIVWEQNGPHLMWENNLVRGKNGDVLRFRYGRHNSDSLLEHYDLIAQVYKTETDSLFWRSYGFFPKDSGYIRFDKRQYDSVLSVWGVNL